MGMLSILIMSLFVPQVAASGGSATIDSSSISLGFSEQTDSASLTYSFDVVEQAGLSADITATSTLKSIGGVLLDSFNESTTILENGVETLTVTFDALPFGYSIIETTLSGDIGSNTSTHQTSFNRTVQRLVPLDIALGSEGDIAFTSLDESGIETGNVTISDGDRLGLLIPVLNNGDYPWEGSMTVLLQSGTADESVNITGIQVQSMSSTLVEWNASIPMTEGEASLTINLNNSGDGDASDESRALQLTVAPPPLPELELQPTMVSEGYVAGDPIEWELLMNNSGTRLFSGQIHCTFGQTTVLNQTLELGVGNSSTLTFNTQARPDVLMCDALGMRLSEASNTPVSVVFDVVSAVFEAAGSADPGVLGGPWHVGDSARFSMLVRNHGDIAGSVALECTTSQSVYTSPSLSLAVDAAGEVSVVVPMLIDGDQAIIWRLVTEDGSVDEGLNGTIIVPVSPKQVLSPIVENVTWDAEVGVTMDWSVTLGEGVDRSVRLRLGYFDSGETYLLDYIVMLAPGVTNGTFELGFIDADRVTLRADAVNWSEAFGPSSNSKSIPSSRPIYSISFDPVASPSRPLAGQSATVKITIVNIGEVTGMTGEVILVGEDNTLYATKTTAALQPGGSTDMTFNLEWPEGSRVGLTAIWSIDGAQLTDSSSFTSASSEVVDEGFTVPWKGILGGVAIAGAAIAALRIKQGQSLSPSSNEKKSSKLKPTSKAKTNASNEAKIEISCPECARQLRVPASYSGSVRCPDCSTRFDVAPETSASEEQEEVEAEGEEDVEVVEEKVEVSCPKCSQSLRVPGSYDGSVRCPACEHVFKAKG